MQVSNESARKTQLGEYDSNILCADCDNVLGVYDKYAIELIRDFPNKHTTLDGDIFVMPDVDGDALSKFMLAVLWRASISARPVFGKVKLDKFQDNARDVLFEAAPLSNFAAYQLMLGRYRSSDVKIERLYSVPQGAPFGDLQAFGFMIAGFRVIAKIDDKPLGPEWNSFIVNGKRSFAGFITDLEKTSEYQSIREMALAEVRRRQGRP